MKKILVLLTAVLFLFLSGCGHSSDDVDEDSLVNNLSGTDETYSSGSDATFSISGTVNGDFSEGVTITLSGDSSATTATASDGTYSFTDLSSGNYTVTASLTGYTFSDAQSVIITAADATGVDFTATNFLGAVTMTQATMASGISITLTWTDPADADFESISIAWTDGTTSGSATVEKGVETYTIPSLDYYTDYTITVTSIDTDGYTTESELSLYTLEGESYSFIYTVADLDAVRNNLNANYILMADLDLNVAPYNQGEGWTPIGYWDYDANIGCFYTGIFNGNNHVISNLYINTDGIDEDDSDKGLFGDIGDDAYIYNLGLESVSVTGEKYTGALAGYAADYCTIENCYSTGAVNGEAYVGGLVGEAYDSWIAGCHAEVTVSSSEAGAESIGGLIGYGDYTYVINCYATGNVTADSDDSSDVGGLIGYGYALLNNCYATGAVSGYEDVGGLIGYNGYEVSNSYATGAVIGSYYVGGLAGYNDESLYNCYATGAISALSDYGGLVGSNNYLASACFYDIDTTLGGTLGSATVAGTPKTTAEMKTQSTFTDDGWDFVGEDANGTDDYWDIDIDGTINSGYPYLTVTGGLP